MREPSFGDVAYGPHQRNVLDLYQADSDKPTPLFVYIHGGGFGKGDKASVHGRTPLLEGCLEAGISLASINYRLSGTDAYPAPMEDGARAIQFLRHKAERWNLDPDRVAAGGNSAGAGITFWIGFRPDLARPDSPDPVERQSTRLSCIVVYNAQTSYDMNFIRTIIPGDAYAHPALQALFRVTRDEMDTPRAKKQFHEASALNYVSREAPPVAAWHSRPVLPMPPDLSEGSGIHHPKFGLLLKEKMNDLGVECLLRLREEFPEGLLPDQFLSLVYEEQVNWLREHLQPTLA